MSKFSACPNCSVSWSDREDFLNDGDVEIIGYQIHFKRLTAGYFLFNHSCMGTFGVEVSAFSDLYDGPVFSERATGSDSCPGHCLQEDQLDPCPTKCECAFVREIIQTIQN